MKTAPIFFLPLFLLGLAAASCTKRVAVSNEPVRERTVEPSGQPVFVTDRPESASSSAAEVVSAPEPAEVIVPITFPAKETEHVRIVDYNPFGSADELAVDLAVLARNFCYPYPGNMISDYGMRGRSMHTGVDIKAVPNDTIRAALSGVVRMSKLYSSYGNIVVIRHPNGLETAYAHNSKNLVSPNDVVRAGDPIALAGRTGRATTEHLHFEVRVMGEHFDPNLLLDTRNRALQAGKLHLKRQNGRILASNSSAGNPARTDNPVVLASNSSSGAPASSSTQNFVTPSDEAYTVQRGDTLYSISRKYGITIDQLCNLNGISREGVLSVGQKLKLK